MPAQQKETSAKGEETVRTKYFREWKGVNTKAARISIPGDTFYDLQNLIPIGPANLHTIPGLSASLHDYAGDSIYWMEYANINSTDYLMLFATNGKVFAYNIGAGSSAQINGGNLLTGSGSRMDQFKNQVIVFADVLGYYTWDGTTFTGPIASGIIPGSPLVSPDIAVFSNRVWLYSGRALYIGVLNSTTDFTLANGAITQNITDPQLRGEATRLFSANGYLYIGGKSSWFVVSDVYIPTGASPPAPVFSILNVQATTGCDQPGSVFVYNRDLCFANTYGLWALRGVTADRLSEDIDGTIQYLDTTFAVSGGVAKVSNILNACFLFKQTGDPVFGTRTLVGMFFDKKWWFANYGALTFVTGGIKNNQPVLFGLLGNKLYQLFNDTVNTPAASWQTPLWPMEDSLADKEVLRAGFEVTTSVTTGTTFTISLDTPIGSTPFLLNISGGGATWQNNSTAIVQWQNNALTIVVWLNGTYLLLLGDAGGGYAKYVGMSGSSLAGGNYELNSNMMDYALRKRW